MKKDIKIAFDVLQSYGILGTKDIGYFSKLIEILQDDGTILKQEVIKTLFHNSKNEQSAYKSFFTRIRTAINESINLSKESNHLSNFSFLSSFKINLFKENKHNPSFVKISVNEKEVLSEGLKNNDSYKNNEYIPLNAKENITEELKKTIDKKSFFISYSSNDNFIARDFIDVFQEIIKTSSGYKSWSMKEIQIGQEFNNEIKKAMEECDFGLCLLSEHFFNSRYIMKKEVDYFLKNNNIIPIGIESKINGKKVSIDDFFQNIKQKSSYENTQEVLKKQCFMLQDRSGDFYENLQGDGKKDFIQELINKINKLENNSSKNKQNNSLTLNKDIRYINENYVYVDANHKSFKTIIHSKKPLLSKELEEKLNFNLLEDLVSWVQDTKATNLYAILGDFGVGKTFTCRMLTVKLASLRERNLNIMKPLYIDLREVPSFIIDSNNNQREINFEEILQKYFKCDDISTIIKDVKSSKSVIIFDGLDEKIVHYNKETQIRFFTNILSILPQGEEKSNCKIVLSCRTHYFENVAKLNSFFTGQSRIGTMAERYKVSYILSFDIKKIDEFLNKVLKQDYKKISIIKDLFEKNTYLGELAKTPFLLNQMIHSVSSLKETTKKINSASFYDILINDTFTRDEEKHKIKESDKKLFLKEFAFDMWMNNTQNVKLEELNDYFRKWIYNNKKLKRKYKSYFNNINDNILEKDLRNSTLLVRINEYTFGFSHSSFQEYFIALYLYDFILANKKLKINKMPSTLSLNFLKDMIFLCENTNKLYPWFNKKLAKKFGIYNKIAIFLLKDMKLDKKIDSLNLKDADLENYNLKNIKAKEAIFDDTKLCDSRWKNCHFDKIDIKNTCFNTSIWIDSSWSLNTKTLNKDYFKYMVLHKSNLLINNSNIKELLSTHPKYKKKQEKNSTFFTNHTSAVYSVAMNDKYIVSGSYDNSIKIWNYDGELINTLKGHSSAVRSVAMNDKYIVSGSDHNSIKIWNYDGELINTLKGHSSAVCSVAMNDKYIVSGSYDNSIKIWNYDGELINTLKGHSSAVSSVAMNDKYIVSGSDDNSIKIWNYDGELINTLKGHSSAVCSVAMNDKYIVSGSYDNSIKIWNYDGELINTLKGHSSAVCSVAMNDKYIVSGSYDNSIKIWNYDGELINTLKGHSSAVYSVAMNDKYIVSGSDDNSIKIWNYDGELINTLKGHSSAVCSVAMNDKYIVSGSYDNSIKIWNYDGELINTLKGHSSAVCSVAMNDKYIVSGSYDNSIKIWNYDGELINTLKGHSSAVRSVAMNDKYIVSGSDHNSIKIWNYDGELINTLKGHSSAVCSVAMNDKYIVSGSDHNSIKIWNYDGELINTLKGHSSAVRSVAMNDKYIVSGSYDNSIKIWNYDGELINTLKGHSSAVYSVAMNDKYIVSGSEDNSIKIWNYDGELINTLKGHSSAVYSVAMNDKYIVSGSDDNSIKIWNYDGNIQRDMISSLDEWLSYKFTKHYIKEAKASLCGFYLGNFVDANNKAFYIDSIEGCELVY